MRKKMKKSLALIISASMLLAAAGCGKKDEKKDSTESGTETSSVATGDAESTQAATEDSTEEWTGISDEEVAAEGPSKKPKEVVQMVDGYVMVDQNFDDGGLGGFITYTNGGSFDLTNKDGELDVAIHSVGGLDYANQIYYDGFMLSEGCVYRYSFDIKSDIARKVEYRLQINGGDYHAYTGGYIDVGPEVLNFESEFTMDMDSDPAPRIVFNMGKMEDMTADPGEHHIYIDNVKLEVIDASNAQQVKGLPDYPEVNASQIGYLPNDTKTVIAKSSLVERFSVVNVDTGETVYSGLFGDILFDKGSDMVVKQGDFSAVTEPGNYKVVSARGDTYEFTIGNDVYDDIYKELVLMMYRQRCGVATDAAIAGDDFKHDACHTGEAEVYDAEKGPTGVKKDVTGGWHDAGDYGRYVVSGAKTVVDFMMAYEDYGVENDDLGIPESGNGVPDVLDEARFELEWMLKMQDEASGGVYHKVSCLVFPETVEPEKETDQLYLAPISTAATGDFAAVMAKASVIYKDIDAEFAKKCLEASKKAWAYIADKKDMDGYVNPEEIVTGEYPDKNTDDERFWAAVELYLAGDTSTADFIKNNFTTRVKNGLGWADIGTYAMYDLIKANPSDLSDVVEEAKTRLIEDADYMMSKGNEDGYFMSLIMSYPWGSNMTVSNNGVELLMAYNITGDEKYKVRAKQQMDYLLGANSMGYCFVTGFGDMTPNDPHHRPSQVAGHAMPGMLVGGPDSNCEDSYAKAVIYGEPAAMCYADNQQSYSTNEVTIYWNSPLILLMSAFLQ